MVILKPGNRCLTARKRGIGTIAFHFRIHTVNSLSLARVSRAPRNLIDYSDCDTLTAQDSMSTGYKAWCTERERESLTVVLSRLQARVDPVRSDGRKKKRTKDKVREYENGRSK